MVPGIPNVFANIETGKVTNNEWLDVNQPSAFEFLGLTKTQRLYGFFLCLGAGFIISIVGAVLFIIGQTALFAVLFVIGLLVSMAGTGFLIGFRRQLKLMVKPHRAIAAALFVGAVVMTFVSAFVLGSDVLVIIFAILTYAANIWLSLSYIPYARSLVKRLVGNI